MDKLPSSRWPRLPAHMASARTGNFLASTMMGESPVLNKGYVEGSSPGAKGCFAPRGQTTAAATAATALSRQGFDLLSLLSRPLLLQSVGSQEWGGNDDIDANPRGGNDNDTTISLKIDNCLAHDNQIGGGRRGPPALRGQTAASGSIRTCEHHTRVVVYAFVFCRGRRDNGANVITVMRRPWQRPPRPPRCRQH